MASSMGQLSRAVPSVALISLYVKDLRAPGSRKRKLEVSPWHYVKDIKDTLAGLLQVPGTSQRLFFRGRELKNKRLLHDCGIDAPGCTIFFAINRETRYNEPRSASSQQHSDHQ